MFTRVKRTYNTIAIICLNLVILFIVVEAGSALIIYAYDAYESNKQVEKPYKYDARENLTYYQQQEWGLEHWKELYESVNLIYQPYVGWRKYAYHGNLINIDESGVRITPNYWQDNEPLLSTFCFGGSTMWGDGSPDWGTIPAYLAEITNAEHSQQSIEVVNYAGGGFISSQEVMQLIQQIKYGHIPDIVVFYDGVNDTGVAYNKSEADIPLIDSLLIEPEDGIRWVRGQPGQETESQGLRGTSSNLNSVRVIRAGLYKLFGYTVSAPKAVSDENLEIDINKLSLEVVSIYLKNMEVVDALSKKYGFDYYFFWQPSLYEESKPLTWEEQETRQGLVRASPPESLEFRHTVYNLIKLEAKKRDHLYYMADVFNNTEEFMFIDGVHIIPEGNRIIAERIANAISDSITKRQSN
ncbi:hypothetical protein ACFLT4_03290 [Chloroflexota bacterium]